MCPSLVISVTGRAGGVLLGWGPWLLGAVRDSQGRGVSKTAGPGAPVPAGLSCTEQATEPKR